MTEEAKKKRDELAELHYKTSGHVATEWAVMNFHSGFDAGYQVAMEEMRNDYEKLHDLKCPICFKNFWWSFAKETPQDRYWKAQAERIKTDSEKDDLKST